MTYTSTCQYLNRYYSVSVGITVPTVARERLARRILLFLFYHAVFSHEFPGS
jgi:hypothetical protein